MTKKALIIEDDEHLAELLSLEVRDLGFESDRCENGQDGFMRAVSGHYNFVLLDLNLPGMDGIEVCKQIRERNKIVPIIVITARAEDISKILLIELGADDYLTKPFNPLELKARIKAVLRRTERSEPNSGQQTVFSSKDLVVEFEKRRVTLRGANVELTKREFDILAALISKPGRPFTRSELSSVSYGYEVTGYDQSVSSHINRLREKLEDNPAEPVYILTVRGVGYCFSDSI